MLSRDSQDDIDAGWVEEVDNRFDALLEGAFELGSFKATRARFAHKYPVPPR